MSRNARNVATIFGQSVVGAIAGMIGAFFVFRNMPLAEVQWGIVGFALSAGALFAFILRAFDTAHVKRLSEGLDEAACNGTYLLLKAASAVAYVAVLQGGILAWTTIVPLVTEGRYGGFESPVHQRVLNAMVWYYLLNAIGEVTRRTYEGERNVVVGQMVLVVEHVIKATVMVYAALGGMDAIALSWSYLAGAVGLALLSLGYALPRPLGRPSRALARSYVDFASHTVAAAAMGAISMNLGPILVQIFWDSAQVGFLTAPIRFVQFLTALGAAMATVLLPTISRRLARGADAATVVHRAMLATAAVLGPAVAVMVAIPSAVLHVVLSDRALPAAPILSILALAGFVGALQSAQVSKVLGLDRPDIVRRLSTVGVTVQVVLAITLIPTSILGVELAGMAALGAATARLVGALVGITLTALVLWRLIGLAPPMELWKPVLAMGLTAGLLRATTAFVPELSFRVWHLVGAAAGAVVVNWTVLWALRGITEEDRLLVRALLHPGDWRTFLQDDARVRRDD